MLALLLQWADSAYPTGGFAYSSGLEAMARWPAFGDMDHMRDYLHLVLEQAHEAELPFLLDMRAAFADTNGQGAIPSDLDFISSDNRLQTFIRIAWEWDAFLHQPTLRRASLAQGATWLRLYEASHGSIEYPSRDLSTHFLSVLAATAGHAGMPARELRELYLHLLLRDQLAAAVRLGLLGSNQAQALHAEVGPVGNREWKDKPIPSHGEAARCAPALELVQALHPHLYVKLFQN